MAQPKTILLVEDYEGFRISLKQLLELEGYTVIEAVTGEEAIEKAQDSLPQLILMDLTLPGIDGFTATKKIKEMPQLKSVPIVGLSAYDAQDVRDEATAAGCDDYMTKPIDFDLFATVLHKLLG